MRTRRRNDDGLEGGTGEELLAEMVESPLYKGVLRPGVKKGENCINFVVAFRCLVFQSCMLPSKVEIGMQNTLPHLALHSYGPKASLRTDGSKCFRVQNSD